MSAAPKEYEIKDMSDLRKIPPDRRAAFISEMPALFVFMDMAAVKGVEITRLVWRDDGLRDHTVTFHVRHGEGG